jgi:serine/threonine-protein kinase 11
MILFLTVTLLRHFLADLNIQQYDSTFFIQRMESTDVMNESKNKPPKIVAQYVLGDVIGEGSYGKVREAFDSETLQRVAMKIMKKKRLKKIPNGEQNVKR